MSAASLPYSNFIRETVGCRHRVVSEFQAAMAPLFTHIVALRPLISRDAEFERRASLQYRISPMDAECALEESLEYEDLAKSR